MEDHGQTFRSKVDAWLALTVAGGLGWIWFSLAQRIWAGRTTDVLDLIVPPFTSALMIWIFRATYYVVTVDKLIVRSGPFRRVVPLSSITRLRATRNPRKAPALSLDRIEVRYGSKQVLVSPRDKPGFVRAMADRAPQATSDAVSTA